MRLIDADTFIEYLGLDAENAREDNLGEIVTLEDFDRQPTAYDVDKVVELLETNSMYVGEEIGAVVVLEDAVEIVKSGGMEWEQVKNEV